MSDLETWFQGGDDDGNDDAKEHEGWMGERGEQ